MKRTRIRIGMMISILALLTACSETPLFYNLEREVLIEDGNLDNGITFNDMFKLTSGADDYYVAGGKQLWYRDTDAKDWSKIPSPSGYNKDASGTTGTVYFNDGTSRIVSAFYSAPGNGKTAIFAATFDNARDGNWAEIANTYVNAHGDDNTDLYFTRYYLFTANGVLFINRVDYHNHYDGGEKTDIDNSRLYYVNSGSAITFANQITMPAGFETTIVKDIYWTGSQYWVIYNVSGHGRIARGNAPGSLSLLDTSAAIDSDFMFEAITRSNGIIILSTSSDSTKHYVYFSEDNGATWIARKTSHKISSLMDISSLTPAVGDAVIIAGTQSYIVSGVTYPSDGYKQINLNITAPPPLNPTIHSNSFSDDDNFDSSDLATASIKGFYLDAANNTLFALTWNKGLWRNAIDGTSRTWIWE